jgi:erythromycin esterase
LEWMRAFNRAPGDHPILTFTSFDTQTTFQVVAGRALAYVKKNGPPDLASSVEAAYQNLLTAPDNTLRGPSSQLTLDQATKVTALLEAHREALVKSAGVAAFQDALRMTRIVAHLLAGSRIGGPNPRPRANYRDEMMAKNIEWLAREAHPGEKIVVWAHNGHVSTRNKALHPFWNSVAMGAWLRQSFGSELYVTGFAIHTGTVRALAPGVKPNCIPPVDESLPDCNKGPTTHVIPVAPADSGTAVLSAAGKPLFLDFAHARKGSRLLGEWLDSAHLFREGGAIWPSGDKTMMSNVPSAAFDGLIFIEKTEAARGIN